MEISEQTNPAAKRETEGFDKTSLIDEAIMFLPLFLLVTGTPVLTSLSELRSQACNVLIVAVSPAAIVEKMVLAGRRRASLQILFQNRPPIGTENRLRVRVGGKRVTVKIQRPASPGTTKDIPGRVTCRRLNYGPGHRRPVYRAIPTAFRP
jgi:hypothetical protein